ncbi:MAG: sigma-54 dependent transcriptional regulator [Polyangiaceae bacterium]
MSSSQSFSAFPSRGPEETAPLKVLIVDDDPVLTSSMARVLIRGGFEVSSASGGEKALDIAVSFRPDVAIVDVRMPGMDGFELARRCDDLRPQVPVVLMTGDDGLAVSPKSERGVFEFVRKPIESFEALSRVLRNAAKQHRLEARAAQLERQLSAQKPFGELVGESSAMGGVYRFIESVAETESTVLVTGESGTGKELVSRAIHARSRRKNRPIICVNCAAIPAELVESELFGHSKGSFTGATTDRAGLFRSADGGTLFLDEVGDLPLNVQAHLLRALQQGEIKAVGSDTVRKVDVRVIAATNVDMQKRIDEGKFRNDLFYRLNVLSVQLPPLRERGEDVILLARRFLERIALRTGLAPKQLSPAAENALRRYRWPGNVRELENALERGFILARGVMIEEGDLPMSAGAPTTAALLMQRSFTPLGLYELPFSEAKRQWLERFETRYVEKALERSAGNVAEAARRAGLDRSNFRRIVRKLKDKDDDES